jgi:hypothetical protein
LRPYRKQDTWGKPAETARWRKELEAAKKASENTRE